MVIEQGSIQRNGYFRDYTERVPEAPGAPSPRAHASPRGNREEGSSTYRERRQRRRIDANARVRGWTAEREEREHRSGVGRIRYPGEDIWQSFNN